MGSGRIKGSKNRVVRDVCRRGHPRTPENTYYHRVTGHIVCRVCDRLWANKNHKRPEYRKKAAARMQRWRVTNKEQERERTVRLIAEKYKFLNGWKAERGCQHCPERDPVCLDLHHRDPKEKEVTISQVIVRWSLQRLEVELAKCDVLCANCHRKLHATDERA